jgi:hypothetical protein
MNNWELNKDAAREVLGNTESFASTLHAIVLKQYGIEAIYGDPLNDDEPMDPLELFANLEEDFSVKIPLEVENKLNAILLATATEVFFENPMAFSSICIAIASGDLGDIVNGAFDEPTVPEMLLGIMEVQLNHDAETEFTPTMEEFIKDILNKESIDTLEDPELNDDEARIKAELFAELKAVGVPDEFIAQAEQLLA